MTPPIRAREDRGIALLVVVFMITIVSALAVGMSESTYIAARMNLASEQRVQAEFLLKSAVNVARVLLMDDATPHDDPNDDVWMQFRAGNEIPGELIGLPDPRVKVSLEIRAEGGKLPILKVQGASDAAQWQMIVKTLFDILGFNDDKDQVDVAGGFKGRHFNSEELVANLVDYMDADTESFSSTNFASGIESSLPKDEPFRNEPLDSVTELASIPGFTAGRVQRLIPFVTLTNSPFININAAPMEVLRALDTDATDQVAQAVIENRPYTMNDLATKLDVPPAADGIKSYAKDVKSKYFSVIAKVDYGNTAFLARAQLFAEIGGRLPDIREFELY